MKKLLLLCFLALASAAGGLAQSGNISFDTTFTATTTGALLTPPGSSSGDLSGYNVCSFTYRLTGSPSGVSVAVAAGNAKLPVTPTTVIAAVTTTTNATTIPVGTVNTGPYRYYYIVIATLTGGTSPSIVVTTACSPNSVGSLGGSGGITIPAFTPGSVPFATGASALGQNNANLFWSTPLAGLDVGPRSGFATMVMNSAFVDTGISQFLFLNPTMRTAGQTNPFLVVSEDSLNTTDNEVTAYHVMIDNHPSGTRASSVGAEGDAYLTGAGTVTGMNGVIGYSSQRAGVSLTNYGIQAVGELQTGTNTDTNGLFGQFWQSGGTASNGYALHAAAPVISAGTLSNYYGLHIGAAGSIGAATLTNWYGMYIGNQGANGGTSNYQFYSNSTAPMVQLPSGFVGIGTTTPSDYLDVHSPADASQGVTFTQELLAHGMTNLGATNSYGSFFPNAVADGAGNGGGMTFEGLSEGNNIPLLFSAVIGTATPGATVPTMKFDVVKKFGINGQSLGSTDLGFGFYNNTTLMLSILGSGNVGFGTIAPAALISCGLTGTTLCTMNAAGSSTGLITFKPQAAAGTYEWDWPITAGTTGQVLTSQGGAGTAMTWATPSGTGTVTHTGSMTANTMTKATAAADITNSLLTDDGTTLTYSGTGGISTTGSGGGQLSMNGSTSGATILKPTAIASGTLTLPAATDQLVGRATTDTLTNKTLTSPTLTTPALGVATATSLNGLTVTTSTGTLTVPNGVVLTGPASSGTVATLGNTNTFTGRQDATGAASTAPTKTGTSLPGTCVVGDLYFKSDATAGQNIYECQSTNTWTQQLNSGGGGSGGGVVTWTDASITLVGTTVYYAPFGGGASPNATEGANKTFVQAAAAVSNFACSTNVAPGGSDTIIFTIRDNGSDTTSVCTITGAGLSGSDTTHSFNTVAGHYYTVKIVASATVVTPILTYTAAFGTSNVGVTSIATTSPITGGTITTTGTIACATCAIGPGSSTANHLAKFSGTDGITLADGGAIPSGGGQTIVFTASANITVTSGSTWYLGADLISSLWNVTEGIYPIIVDKASTITDVSCMTMLGGGGTQGTVSSGTIAVGILVNNSGLTSIITDNLFLAGASGPSTTVFKKFTTSGLSIAVAQGDQLEIKMVAPTMSASTVNFRTKCWVYGTVP